MKNLKISKRLFAILLTGTIALTTTSCHFASKDKTANVSNMPQVTVETYAEAAPVEGNEQQTEETPTETVGKVEIAPTATKILNTADGLILIRDNDHLAIVDGNVIKTTNDNPLYSYKEMSGKGTTTTDVTFRLSPTTEEDNKIETLDANTNVEVLGKTDDNWYLIRYGETLGFIKGDYLRIMLYDVNANYELTENTVRVVPAIQATTNVKIRKEANEYSTQLDLLRKDHSIKMIELLPNGWYAVEYKGDVAYVCSDYVKETIMVDGNPYKLIALKEDTEIYDAPNGNITGYASIYDCGGVYSAIGEFFLIQTDEGQVGYIRKSATKNLTDTTAIVDISDQTLTVISDNKIVLTSPIVSGLANSDRESDLGIFAVRSKERNAVLEDEAKTYSSLVDYWMPYNGGEGMHDANRWRSRYGGDIYKTNGSHGCINLPQKKAAELFGIISVGDNVVVHK